MTINYRAHYAIDVYDDVAAPERQLIETFFFKTNWEGRRYFAEYAKHYPIYESTMEKSHDPCFYIEISFSNQAIYTTKPGYLGCVVDATTALMGSFHGRQLHSTDKEWAAWHPYATNMGVPAPHTPTFIQDLLEPYAFGVSRVAVYQDSTYGDESDLDAWKAALGINPMGAVDRRTSNIDFCIATGMPFDVADQLFRFEYRREPLAAAVVGECGWSGSGVGSLGGHAVYRPPRGHYGHWEFSVQVLPLPTIQYNGPVPSTAHMPRRPGVLHVDFDKVQAPDGALIVIPPWGRPTTPVASAPTPAPTASLPSVTPSVMPGASVPDATGAEQPSLFPDYDPQASRDARHDARWPDMSDYLPGVTQATGHGHRHHDANYSDVPWGWGGYD